MCTLSQFYTLYRTIKEKPGPVVGRLGDDNHILGPLTTIEDMPMRKIIKNTHTHKANMSHGIVYAKLVNSKKKNPVWPNDYKFLIVKRRSTYEFESLVRGTYSDNTVHAVISGLTAYEIDLVKRYSYQELWEDVRWGDLSYMPSAESRRKFKKMAQLIRALPDDFIPASDINMWSFPKGKTCTSDGCPYATARREFMEETLMQLPHRPCQAGNPLGIVTILGSNFKVYDNTFYLHVEDTADVVSIPRQTSIKTPCRKIWLNEIQEISWVPFSDLHHKLSDVYIPLIERIRSHPAARLLSEETAGGCEVCEPQQ